MSLESSKLESLSLLTSLLAAILESSPSVGVYWGAASATHDPEFFVTLAQDEEITARIMLWNGVSIANEDNDHVSLLSMGMDQLGLPDLWLLGPKGNETLEWFFNLLGYVASRGAALPEGDTIGRSPEEKLRVHYVKSPIDKKTKVWRVEIDEP